MSSIESPSVVRLDVARPAGNVPTLSAAGPEGARQDHPLSGKAVPALSEQASAAINPEDLSRAVTHLNDFSSVINRDLEFILDEELNEVIVRVYDTDTAEVIRQIPAEEVLQIARNLAHQESVILDTEA